MRVLVTTSPEINTTKFSHTFNPPQDAPETSKDVPQAHAPVQHVFWFQTAIPSPRFADLTTIGLPYLSSLQWTRQYAKLP